MAEQGVESLLESWVGGGGEGSAEARGCPESFAVYTLTIYCFTLGNVRQNVQV